MRRNIYLGLMFLLLAAGRAGAGLPEFEKEVLTSNPSLKAAHAQWVAARARVPQAAAWEDPRLSADATSGGDVSVSLSQALPFSGRLTTAADIARAGVAAEGERLRRKQITLLMQTRIAWHRLAHLNAQLTLNREAIAWVDQAKSVASSRYANNVGGQLPVLAAESAAARLEAERSRLQQEAVVARADLNALRNRSSSDPIAGVVLDDDFHLAMVPDAEHVLRHSPEVALARWQAVAARAGVELARRERRAEPELALGVERRIDSGEPMNAVTVGVSIGLPWLNGGKYDARVTEARAMAEAADRELEAAQAEALRMRATTAARLRAARERVESLRTRALPAARRAFDAALAAYRNNAGEYGEVSDAFRMRLEVENEVIDAISQWGDASAEIRSVAGDPTPENRSPSSPSK